MPSTLLHSFSGVIFWHHLKTPPQESRIQNTSLLKCLVLANLADFDLILRLFCGLHIKHGVYTHNLLFAAVAALLVGSWQCRRLSFCSWAFALLLTHLALDLLSGQHLGLHTSHGGPLLNPFYSQNLSAPITLFWGVRHSNMAELFSFHNGEVLIYEIFLIGLILAVWRGYAHNIPREPSSRLAATDGVSPHVSVDESDIQPNRPFTSRSCRD
jgi:hypothetical protein